MNHHVQWGLLQFSQIDEDISDFSSKMTQPRVFSVSHSSGGTVGHQLGSTPIFGGG